MYTINFIAREKRIVGLVGGRTEPSPKASELQRVTKSRNQEYELNFRAPSRTARIPTYLKLTRGRSWQRKPDGEREIDSSLTNAEREPSKRRRSLDEARLKFKRDRENGRRILQTSGRRMHDDYYEWSTVGSMQRGVHYQHRTNTHRSKPYMHESEPYMHYSANSSDMAIPKFSRKSKSRRPSNQSATLKKVGNFDLTEESAKQALRGGRYDQRHVAGSTADTKISEAKIFDKTAILKPKTKVRLKDKAGRKKTAYNITIKDNISQKSRRRSMKLPRTPNISGAESYASTMRNKKSCRPAKVTQSFLRSGRHGRPSKPNPATVTGKGKRSFILSGLLFLGIRSC